MQYTDRVYGKFEIDEPVVLELIKSPAIQRLKDIDQAGYRPLWKNPDVYVGEYDHSRFAHSLGVYLLLKKYNASIEEQIAGLIHDVSHSAFSHCIDYVLDCGSEKEHNHQDNLFESFVRRTEIPEILKKYNFDLEYILDDKNFPLKEKSLPDLCADRIDHSLKTAIIFGVINETDKNYILDHLIAEDGNWVFNSFESAKKYAELFLGLNREWYAGFPSALMFRAVGDYLRHALQKGYINENDLYATDSIVLLKIEKYHNQDEGLNLLFKRMQGKIGAINDFQNYDAEVFCKSRIINPLFKDGNTLRRISEVDPGWNLILEQESKPKQHFIKFDK